MPSDIWPVELASSLLLRLSYSTCFWVFILWPWATAVFGLSIEESRSLREQTIEVFYHGYDNYMKHAFPEDELKPISCGPLTRDQANPAHIEVNDVLGNYSLTLIDSLSTLAILASSTDATSLRRSPLQDFQNGVAELVKLYGDGTDGPKGQGKRSRGFDLDSKVQVFETTIRGVGGLLSAHLFATGELPINGYKLPVRKATTASMLTTWKIQWPTGFVYDGQLLRLALDLGQRLVPAFHTATGLPYPRVNLRHGIPFYLNSPLNWDSEHGQCQGSPEDAPEITETCSAGAGSLVLEFTVLSRLTGAEEFERMAKRAFWAVWERRSNVGLIGAGVDAETGQWVSPYTGIGAGIDSFFEYALKSHILLAGSSDGDGVKSNYSGADFLSVWQDAHLGIKRHLYRGSAYQHPHYIQADLFTGATKAFWIDSLSAYYPGLLTLGGELEEATETHLLYTALWSRYSALPERWSTTSGKIESELRWWGGRPEFIESTWYLYRATQDPWYLHVGEMALSDIKRRCWTPCGWAGLEDVRTGEQKDRMESFFLGETVKYLYLLFDPDHPLNKLDAPFVFTTEGHPLLIPKSRRKPEPHSTADEAFAYEPGFCPIPPTPVPFTISAVASRNDLFHAASLARLHTMPRLGDTAGPSVEAVLDHPSFIRDITDSPTNYTFYPWTLPAWYVPFEGTSSTMHPSITFDLSFPTIPDAAMGSLGLRRVAEGIQIQSVSSLRVGMIKEMAIVESGGNLKSEEVFRVHSLAHLTLGRDEKVFVSLNSLGGLNPADPYFTRQRDLVLMDIVLNATPRVLVEPSQTNEHFPISAMSQMPNASITGPTSELLEKINLGTEGSGFFNSIIQQILSAIETPEFPRTEAQATVEPINDMRQRLTAIAASGPGAAPVPDVPDAFLKHDVPLPWGAIYMSDEMCTEKLPVEAARNHQIIVIKRGGCSFSEKLQNIPAFLPSSTSLQLVIIVAYPDAQDADYAAGVDGVPFRPHLHDMQYTSSGLPRQKPIPVVMVGGGDETYDLLRTTSAIGLKRRYHYLSQNLRISNLVIS